MSPIGKASLSVSPTGRRPISLRALPLFKVYQFLEPGPVVLMTTVHRGIANVMTMSWHMMIEFEPPQIACVVSRANYSFAALRANRECVIGIPARPLASKVVKIGNSSGRDIDKFAAFGLTTAQSEQVTPPLIQECFVNLECKVIDTGFVHKYDLFILEVFKGWTDPGQKDRRTIHHQGYGRFVIDGKTIHLKSRMR